MARKLKEADKTELKRFYKIYDNVNKVFVEAGMRASAHGKTWSTLAHAKTAIAVHSKNREGRYSILAYASHPIEMD